MPPWQERARQAPSTGQRRGRQAQAMTAPDGPYLECVPREAVQTAEALPAVARQRPVRPYRECESRQAAWRHRRASPTAGLACYRAQLHLHHWPSTLPVLQSGRRIYPGHQASAAVSLSWKAAPSGSPMLASTPAERCWVIVTPMRRNYESSSGADTPSNAKPFRRTWRTAPTRASRANVSFESSALTNRKATSWLPLAQKPWKAPASS
jgi:hypothetical protein